MTDRAKPVARLVPVVADAWADMIASGKVTPAEHDDDIADEVPRDYDVDASAALAALRAGPDPRAGGRSAELSRRQDRPAGPPRSA